MHAITSNLIALQQLVSYLSAFALLVLLLFLWRRLRTTGLLLVAIGGILNLVARIAQAVIPPFRMGTMPFSRASTLDDVSRSTEFILVHSCHVLAGVLIVAGVAATMRTWRGSALKPALPRGVPRPPRETRS